MVEVNAIKLQAPRLNHKSKENFGQGSPFAIVPITFIKYVDLLLETIKSEGTQEGYKFDLASLIEEVESVRDRAFDEITCLPLDHRWAACLRYKHALYNSIKHHRIVSPFQQQQQADDNTDDDEIKRIRVPRTLLNKLQRLHTTMKVTWTE